MESAARPVVWRPRKRTLEHFLDLSNLGSLAPQLVACQDVGTVEALLQLLQSGSRLQLFATLRSHGIGPEGARQRLANALSKAQRRREIGLSPELTSPSPCRCVAHTSGSRVLDDQQTRVVLGCISRELNEALSSEERRLIAQRNQPSAAADDESLPPPLPPALPPLADEDVPLVSVVVPTTHERHWCHATLYACFASQTWTRKELVVLDDGPAPSPFFTSLDDPRVDYCHSTAADTPLGEKRNRLSARASGAVLAHFDDDDVYLPGYLTRMVTALLDHRADLVSLASWVHFSAADETVHPYSSVHDRAAGHHSRKWGYGFSFVYTAALAAAVPFLPIQHGEDYVSLPASDPVPPSPQPWAQRRRAAACSYLPYLPTDLLAPHLTPPSAQRRRAAAC
jgi:hypothetical protein